MGKRKEVDGTSPDECYEHVLSTLRGSEDGAKMKVKSLRKLVLLALQTDEDDKDGKKRFKRTVKTLEEEGKLSLDADGLVTLSKSERKKHKHKKSKKTKKRTRDEKEDAEGTAPTTTATTSEHDDVDDDENDVSAELPSSSAPCAGNPHGTTRLFVGNLPFSVNEESLAAFCAPGEMTHVKWITDKETGRFYGSAFLEMADSRAAATVTSKNGEKLGGRPVKTNYAPARPGDAWPPPDRVTKGGGGGGDKSGKGGDEVKELPAQPDGCQKLFVGNLSYEIDDDAIFKFFEKVEAEVKAVRWIHHKDSGDFKGVGFVEFWNVEACAKAATLNGKKLLGRPVRIDWTD